MQRTQRHPRQRVDAVDVLRICIDEALAQEVTDIFFFGSALYSPHPNNFDFIVLGVPSNHDSRKRLENAMAAKTGWTIDVHCLERDSPWLHRLDGDGAGVWLLRGGRFTTTAVEVMDGKLAPTYVGRLGLRQFVRFLVSNLKVFALALHKRASITFPDLYDAAQRLWKLFLDFKRVAYDTCSRDKVVDKLEEVLSIDLSDLRALAQHCRAHLAVWSSKSQQTESGGSLPPVGLTVYHAVSEIVRHSIHSEGLRQAVLDVVCEIEASSVNNLDSIRVPDDILMRLPKRPDDGSLHAPPLPMGRPNVSSLKSDGGGVLLENVSITGGKRPRSTPRTAGERRSQPQPKRGDGAAVREGSSSASDMLMDQGLPSGRPSKRNRVSAAADDAGESNRGRRGQDQRNAPTGERRPRGEPASLDLGLQSARLARPARDNRGY